MDKENKEKDGGSTDTGRETSENLGQTSAADALTSKIEEGKQYGGAEVRKLVQDALAADGREQKRRAETAEASLRGLQSEHEGLKTQFTTVSDQVAQLLRAQDDAEAEKIKDDPVALSSLRARQENRKEEIRLKGFESNLNVREGKLNERETGINQRETSLNIRDAAIKHGVDAKQLEDLVPDGNPERLARAANILKQSGFTGEGEENKGNVPAGLRNKPASAISAGGDARSLSARILAKAKGEK